MHFSVTEAIDSCMQSEGGLRLALQTRATRGCRGISESAVGEVAGEMMNTCTALREQGLEHFKGCLWVRRL